jgi:hypothetical protein
VGKGSVRVGGDKPGGLGQQQEALAFQKGTRYTFRWWLKSETDQLISMRIADDKNKLTIVQLEQVLKPGDWQFWTDEFYRWQDGLLPVDKRPPFKVTSVDILLPDTDDWDNQELGTDEFMALCREIGCEASLTMRLCGTQAEDAGSWVEYCNDGPLTKWGKVRAGRGYQKPYGVKTWFIGNEVYYFGYADMNNPANCARQTKAFAAAMKSADPSVRLVGCTYSAEWNKPLFEQAGTLLSYTSIHEYDGGGLNVEAMSKAPTTSLWPKLQKAIAQRQTQPPLPAILDEWSTGWGKPGTVGSGLNTAGVLNLLCRERGRTLDVADTQIHRSRARCRHGDGESWTIIEMTPQKISHENHPHPHRRRTDCRNRRADLHFTLRRGVDPPALRIPRGSARHRRGKAQAELET